MKKSEIGQQQDKLPILQQKLSNQSPRKPFKYNREKAVHEQHLKLTDLYYIGEKIGAGSFGQVYKVQHKQLKLNRAVKLIKKSVKNPTHDPKQQLVILKQLDHPNVLKIYQYFQDQFEWQIVTEYFQGHQLFDEILTNKGLTENKAAKIFAQICKALAYIHKNNIVHRDLKPQNIMVENQANDQYVVKLIDWGLGCKAVKQLSRKCGTPEYCAPEVFKGSYGFQCDLWSLGVLLYVMLVGKFPFKGQNIKQTVTLITKAAFSFDYPYWENISLDVKLLISKLLQKDPKLRISASQCLKHPWVVKNTGKTGSQQNNKLTQTLQRLRQVNYQNKFQTIVVNFILNYLQESQQQLKLKKQFELIDQNKDGVISYQQLKKSFDKIYGPVQSQQMTKEIFQKIDINSSNQIEYSEFITFASKINKQFTKEQLKQAFRHFDQNQDGKINKAELRNFLFYQKKVQSQDFNNLISQIDRNCDGSIDFDQFVQSITRCMKNGEYHGIANKDYFCQDLALSLLESTRVKKRLSAQTHSNCQSKEDKLQL